MAKKKTASKRMVQRKKTISKRKIKSKAKVTVAKNKIFWKIERIIIILAAVVLVSFLSFAVLAIMEYINMNEYVEADVIKIIDTTVVLGNNCTAIIAQTSPERAASIQLGLDKKINVRPNTHDIFTDVLKNFNITLESVTMDRFEEDIYYATLHLKRGNEKLKLDSKPSDAVAIALRMESPVYIKKDLLKKHGQSICK
ncbi:MAG: bifunctional nuclease family protein [Candidatus Aenigmarchaeota archaeon]|nr:bifunctional nuclease family protein [Candidatus Aenigmarchaeota archaeon]